MSLYTTLYFISYVGHNPSWSSNHNLPWEMIILLVWLISVCIVVAQLSDMHDFTSRLMVALWINTLRPRQNGRHFADEVFKCFFLNENVQISLKISLKFVPKGPINNIPALVHIMPWCRPGDMPLGEPVMVSLLTHICVTRPQWVNTWKVSM